MFLEKYKRFIPGLRIIKTALAVLLCLILFFSFGNYKPIYAAIACVLMMKESHEKTWEVGLNRIIGTMLGGLISLITLLLMNYLNVASDSMWVPVFLAAAIFFDLLTSKIFRLDTYVASISGVVLLITLLSYGSSRENVITYVLLRTQETIIGIIIAFLVNRYFNPPKLFNKR